MKEVKILAAIVLPILVLAGWVLTISYSVKSGRFVHLAVRGYDPRDLLAGHYLTYQLDFGEIRVCSEGAPYNQRVERCVCVEESNSSQTLSKATWSGECSMLPANCPAYLRGECEYGRFESGLERFYFPEEYSDALMTIPPEASVMISTDKHGQGVVLEFLVGRQPYQQFVAEFRSKKLEPTVAPTVGVTPVAP